MELNAESKQGVIEEISRIDNFAKAGGLISDEFVGRRYNDSDVFKVMEGATYSLSLNRDSILRLVSLRSRGDVRLAP